jgi:small subunit ribosomal protein S1
MDESESSPREAPPTDFPAADNSEMKDLLEQEASAGRLRRGEVVEGVVVQVGRDEILVDVGSKAEAIIPADEAGVPPNEILSSIHVGETIVAMVLETENREGHATLSLARAQTERGWRTLQRLLETGETLEAPVVDFNRGGLVVNVDGVRGFVPLSQIVDLRQPGAADESVESRLERMKGRQLELKVIELNRRRNRVILSERAAYQERRVRDRDRLIDELAEGQTRTGRVTSVADFGAFVDVGGADGLVHLTELSWAPVSHPSQIVHVGDEVEVLVLGVDREKKKIALSLKRLREEPWDKVTERYAVGQTVPARVTKLATFGAFAEIEAGVEGLIHISELSDERIQNPRSVVREGDQIVVKILRIESDRHRLGLSLKQVQSDVEEADLRSRPMVFGGDEDEDSAGSWMGGARVIDSRQDKEASDSEDDESPDEPRP